MFENCRFLMALDLNGDWAKCSEKYLWLSHAKQNNLTHESCFKFDFFFFFFLKHILVLDDFGTQIML